MKTGHGGIIGRASRRFAAALLLLAAIGVGGCGSGSKPQAGRDQIVSRSDAICRQATEQARSYVTAHPSPNTVETVKAALEEDGRIALGTATKLAALHPPAERRAVFERLIAAQRELAGRYRAAADALATGQDSTFQSVSGELTGEVAKVKRAAVAYGLTDCPARPISVQFDDRAAAGGSGGGTPTTTTTASPPAPARQIEGRWSGQVLQIGPGRGRFRYPLFLTIQSAETGTTGGTIRYPTFPCGGRLVVRRPGAALRIYREVIEYGKVKCAVPGTVTVRLSGDQLTYHWVGTRISVRGRLRRA